MELINYLNEHFLTRDELLETAKISEETLRIYQEQQVMPGPSYRLFLSLSCDSYFGEHDNEQRLEYYAKGYLTWLGILQSLDNLKDAFIVFKERYIKTIDELEKNGYEDCIRELKESIDEQVEQEWGHFLNGTYGLCTKSGLPEDIAAKELAIREIKRLISFSKLSDEQLSKLAEAVNLLDEVSALFAPHEKPRSSRQRLIDDVRMEYRL